MGRWRNFSIWKGRLPHWRADDVTYYVTFRHSRPLEERERDLLLDALRRPDARKWDLEIVCVLPEVTELMVAVRPDPSGAPYELADVVEKAKTKAGRKIQKLTGERFPPFYGESYDRIVRDEAEFDERWGAILESPVTAELAEDPEEYPFLYVRDAPD